MMNLVDLTENPYQVGQAWSFQIGSHVSIAGTIERVWSQCLELKNAYAIISVGGSSVLNANESAQVEFSAVGHVVIPLGGNVLSAIRFDEGLPWGEEP